ncbi:Bacterial extracellular solute-binding protein,family 7 [Moorella glycerini]|uniref:C4-dicarboxylate-binding periplasmic protein n=1 Tax=Neomoorella stamsii TaxID=1266720 RepID=A0A9X7P4K1_9FIRM|nr:MULTISPECIES: TRAP transporter substrate-binding protein DctP [Moorella]PRR68563.1 C4-dicarboxylate-binding periplasmic protein precursor [Moorella stamsii]CEP66113.1 Bacterial extracellular solute-binding protein,family 7 [Moorella glycerini]
MNKTRYIFVACLSLVLMVALAACAPASEPTPGQDGSPITLVFTTHDPESTWWVQNIIKPWLNEIEQASGGRIKIEPHWGGELVDLRDAYDAVVKGTVDIAYFNPGMIPGQFPLDEFCVLLSPDKINWRPSMTYWELIQQFPEMQAEYSETQLLAVGKFFQPYLGTGTKPIKSFADMKGLRWLSVSEWSTKRLEAWGAVPANVPPADLYTSLQRGILDGCTTSLNTLFGNKLGEVIKYITKVSNESNNIAVVMNKDKWNSLPPDLQEILRSQGLKFIQMFDEAQIAADKEFREKAIKEYNIQFIELPQEEVEKFKAAGAAVLDDLAATLDAKGLPGTKVKEAFLQLEEKYSAPEYEPK